MKNHKAAFSAENYDRDILNTIPYYDEVYTQIADVASTVFLNKAVSWLDIGCGTGKMAEVAFKRCNVEKMICIDNSSAMLEVAKQKIGFSSCQASGGMLSVAGPVGVEFLKLPIEEIN